MHQSGNTPQTRDDLAHQRPFQETLHIPSARWSRDPANTSSCAKTQEFSIIYYLLSIIYLLLYIYIYIILHILYFIYFVLPRKQSIIVCSEQPSGKNRITQDPTGGHLRTYSSMEIIKTPQRRPIFGNLYVSRPFPRRN